MKSIYDTFHICNIAFFKLKKKPYGTCSIVLGVNIECLITLYACELNSED